MLLFQILLLKTIPLISGLFWDSVFELIKIQTFNAIISCNFGQNRTSLVIASFCDEEPGAFGYRPGDNICQNHYYNRSGVDSFPVSTHKHEPKRSDCQDHRIIAHHYAINLFTVPIRNKLHNIDVADKSDHWGTKTDHEH